MTDSTLLSAPLFCELVLAAAHPDPGLRLRLGEMGLRPGSRLRVVQRTVGGGRVIEVASTRIALDRRTCRALAAAESAHAA
ncbi:MULTISPECIES: FeoA family protein [Helcobacillus]|uniref:Ferrous iron transport protein A n=1 Tax=Helcobacillus massiliensis TaxID=521392 RepID=A0A839QTH2_9MICO|nr:MULTISPECIES: FeoA family protein [Helcobacillus]MBB3023035.1 ferrous iron transport protein A [Helcobacillus massiliensis]MCG7426048.1 ferrous iron transport protein A [Helcobacillus sp. ACRRO]MDK7741523.1 FeoA family protein [Helcobacillus massiliensis]WOO92357.1 FeoA family protein [Helcobacillus massiliensis]